MGNDFDEYEREYLKRHARGLEIKSETLEEGKIRVFRERVEAARDAATKADLDVWDYVVMEMLRREDPRISIKVGTVRSSESILKLFCHRLITKLNRAPTFDELERIQMFLDSAEHKQYERRLRKLMTKEVAERLKIIIEITGIHNQKEMWDITDEGKNALQAKHAEIITLYEKMDKQYRNNKADFYRDAESYMWALPMMVVLGIGTGAMMAYMHSISNVPYMMFDGADSLGFTDAGSEMGEGCAEGLGEFFAF